MTDENTDPQTAGTEPTVPDWLLPNRAYDVLKWVALIVLPAIGVVIGASTLKARASKA